MRDTVTGTTTLVRRATGVGGAAANDSSFGGSISADGRFVAFQSNADNLSSADNNSFLNVFVRDTQTGTTTLISRVSGSAGVGANGDSSGPSISADGRFVALHSRATNLSRERTVYTLTDKGLEALREYARTPVSFQPLKSELLLRLLIADLVRPIPEMWRQVALISRSWSCGRRRRYRPGCGPW